jgi:DNA-binding IclR family transcriptional regulator
MNEESYPYKSLNRISEILLCLKNNINSVSEIAEYLGITKSTVSRLLHAMEKAKMIIQNPISQRYFLGQLIAVLSSKPQDTHRYLVASSMKEMRRLRELSGERVFLSITVGIQYVQLQVISKDPHIGVSEDNRLLGPQLLGATAKVLLSQLNPEELELALKYFEIDRSESLSSMNRDELILQLEEIKRQRYAVSHGERNKGRIGISSAIRGYICPAALSIAGAGNHLEPRLPEMINEVKQSAENISTRIQN